MVHQTLLRDGSIRKFKAESPMKSGIAWPMVIMIGIAAFIAVAIMA